jgi:outer membrane protein assembly factor BamB
VRISSINWLAVTVAIGAWLSMRPTEDGAAGSAEARYAIDANKDWPCWRGPSADNHSAAKKAPLYWSAEQGLLWKSSVPGRGHASPCVVGDKVYLASADESSGAQFLLAYDRRDGRQLWRRDLHVGKLPKINEKNSHASATPASDGRRIYTVFATSEDLWASAVEVDGRVVWQTRLGRYAHANGLGASPVLFDGLLIVASDNQAEPELTALETAEGAVKWQVKRPQSDNSATPIVGRGSGRPQLLLNGARSVSSYDPLSGGELWHVTHKTEVAACTMAFDSERVIASGNVPEPLMLAVRGDGSGDVTESGVVWQSKKSNTYVPSPLVVGPYVFLVIDGGVAFCRDVESGDVIWQHRLGGKFSASPLLADGNIYALNEEGKMHIFRASAKWEPVAENDLNAECLATPAISDSQIFLRTNADLYAIVGTDDR